MPPTNTKVSSLSREERSIVIHGTVTRKTGTENTPDVADAGTFVIEDSAYCWEVLSPGGECTLFAGCRLGASIRCAR